MIAARRSVGVGLGLVVLLALGAWVAGRQVRSPAQIAAEAAAPTPGAITVPVERRVLASEVIVRGTVRYGSPQPVVLATSQVKQGSGDSEIVTQRPRGGQASARAPSRCRSRGARCSSSGHGALSPRHRSREQGPDVGQLESALVRLGFSPGPVDGRYDGETGAAVAAWYESEGWAPFGPTDIQIDQLRTANAAAAAARDLHLQARLAIQSAARGSRGARSHRRASTSRRLVTESTPRRSDRGQLRSGKGRQGGCAAHERHHARASAARRDNELAVADVALKRATLNKAVDAQTEAQRNLAEAPPDTSPAERAALEAAVRQAADDIAVAQLDLRAANRSAAATRAAGDDAVAIARADRARAISSSRSAAAARAGGAGAVDGTPPGTARRHPASGAEHPRRHLCSGS